MAGRSIEALREQSAASRDAVTTCGHVDGFDYIDYLASPDAWNSRVLAIAGTAFEGELAIAAAKDYRWHIQNAALEGGNIPPRGKYIADHIAGQICRALESVE